MKFIEVLRRRPALRIGASAVVAFLVFTPLEIWLIPWAPALAVKISALAAGCVGVAAGVAWSGRRSRK
jgi:hypothetical protein